MKEISGWWQEGRDTLHPLPQAQAQNEDFRQPQLKTAWVDGEDDSSKGQEVTEEENQTNGL